MAKQPRTDYSAEIERTLSELTGRDKKPPQPFAVTEVDVALDLPVLTPEQQALKRLHFLGATQKSGGLYATTQSLSPEDATAVFESVPQALRQKIRLSPKIDEAGMVTFTMHSRGYIDAILEEHDEKNPHDRVPPSGHSR